MLDNLFELVCEQHVDIRYEVDPSGGFTRHDGALEAASARAAELRAPAAYAARAAVEGELSADERFVNAICGIQSTLTPQRERDGEIERCAELAQVGRGEVDDEVYALAA